MHYGIDTWSWALNHFIHEGMAKGLQSAPVKIDNTNFDWEYYIEQNNISGISNKTDAYKHYIFIGRAKHFPYCKTSTIVILFHLYNLKLLDEFIEKINFFMENNPENRYFIKINIPVDDRVFSFNCHRDITNIADGALDYVRDHTPYHKSLITHQNAAVLLDIYSYIEKRIHLPREKMQIIFSQNKGFDVGGFFLLLDQIKKEGLQFDFLVKLHTKRLEANHPGEHYGPDFGTGWRAVLTSFLNIKINVLLRKYECIYSSKLDSIHDGENYNPNFITLKKELCAFLDIHPSGNYDFCAGTIFIAPYAFYDAIQSWDFCTLFDMMHRNIGGVSYAHVYERLFGYIFKKLRLKVLCLGYYSPEYPVSCGLVAG